MQASSVLPFGSHDGVSDSALALELQRFYERQAEELELDETVAYSLTLDEARLLTDSDASEDEDDDEDDDFVHISGDRKPPPKCSCCLASLTKPKKRRAMPCGHLYCLKCIATRCKMGVLDRSMVPAHCCKREFPMDYVKETLAEPDWKTYERFVSERQWLMAGNGLSLASDAEYAATVAKHGWKQCPQCGVGVERVDGCNAMTCPAKHNFCWGCGTAPCRCANYTDLRPYGYRG